MGALDVRMLRMRCTQNPATFSCGGATDHHRAHRPTPEVQPAFPVYISALLQIGSCQKWTCGSLEG